MRHSYATRINSFVGRDRPARLVGEAIPLLVGIDGLTSVEINFPQHVDSRTGNSVIGMIRDAKLDISAINLRYDAETFARGAFTHPSLEIRRRAVDLAVEAVEIARAQSVGHVILWMGPDGVDYPFQADYAELWAAEVDGFRAIAAEAGEVRVSVEYKPSDPRRTSLIRSMGDALLAVHAVGRPNFGVTLDFCHSLMAGEQPAIAAAQAVAHDALFGIHLNDGYGQADDGMMVGSVHPWQTLDLLWQLRRGAFGGTIYFDTFPERLDPAAECAGNIRAVEALEDALDRLPAEEMANFQADQDALGATEAVRTALWGR